MHVASSLRRRTFFWICLLEGTVWLQFGGGVEKEREGQEEKTGVGVSQTESVLSKRESKTSDGRAPVSLC